MTQCYPEQLGQQLQQGLRAVYLLFGDEPLQKFEAISLIRQAAAQMGFEGGQRFIADSSFDWSQLSLTGSTMSLFSRGQLIELELPTAAPGRDGSQWLLDYTGRLQPDQILLIHGPRIGKDKQKSKWFQALQACALSITINVPSGTSLQRWLNGRCQRHQVSLQADAQQLLLELCEGNLLAADQELQKLALLYGQQPVTLNAIQESLASHARHNVFQLCDALLAGEIPRSLKILDSLQGEGLEPVIVCWAISKEALLLKQLAETAVLDSRSMLRLGIWQQRQALFQQALRRLSPTQIGRLLVRCAELDQGLKDGQLQHPWSWLNHLSLMFAGNWEQETLFITEVELTA